MQRETLRLPEGTDPLQTYENGKPLGSTRFLDFGPGIQSTLIGDDFVRVTADAGAGEFDAVVDAALSVSDPNNRLFKGLGEALTYLTVTVGLNRANVLVRDGTYTEASNWSQPQVTYLFGSGYQRTNGAGTVWNHAGFTSVATNAEMHVADMRIEPGNKATFWSGIAELYASRVQFYFQAATTPSSMGVTFGNYFECTFPIAMNFGSTRAVLIGGEIAVSGSTVNTATLGGSQVFMIDVTIGSSSSFTWTMPAFTVIRFSRQGALRAGSYGSGTITLSGTTAGGAYDIECHAFPNDGSGAPITVSLSNADLVILRGEYQAVTVGAPRGPLSPNAGRPHDIDITARTAIDITGPARINLGVTGINATDVTLRGNGIVGHVSVHDHDLGSGTELNYVACSKSVISCAVQGTYTGTRKPYAFDASSNDNLLLFETTLAYAAAGTDLGLRNVVLPEDFPGGFAGPHIIEDEGVGLPQRANLNFVGAGVTVTDSAPDTIVTIPGGAGHVIQDEGVSLAARTNLNFVGAGVTVTDDAGNDQTDVTIPGGGGGGGDTLVAWVGL